MELRQPPQSRPKQDPDRWVRGILALVVVLLGAIAWLIVRGAGSTGSDEIERNRTIASKLLAAGAMEEAAALYEEVLSSAAATDDNAAKMAYSIAKTYAEVGQYEKALRWYYEAEFQGADDLAEEVSSGIVSSLERLGRHHAAQTALEQRAQLGRSEVARPDSDPVVATIGSMEIRLSEVERALDELSPELESTFAGPEGRANFLEKYVADELIWRKASKLEYDRDPEVLRRHREALKQLAVVAFVEQEILQDLKVDEADLRNHFEANKARYQAAGQAEDGGGEITFESARPVVEAEYRMRKMQSVYEEIIASEIAAPDVEIYPERMNESS